MIFEKDIEQFLIKEIEKLNGRCDKWGINGEPDRIVMLPGGKVFFVELKRPKGKLSKLQIEKHKRLRVLGFKVYTPYSKDDVRKIIVDMTEGEIIGE